MYIFNLSRYYRFSDCLYQFSHQPTFSESSSFPIPPLKHFLANTLIASPRKFSHSDGYTMSPFVVLICIFVTSQGVKHLFRCLLALCVPLRCACSGLCMLFCISFGHCNISSFYGKLEGEFLLRDLRLYELGFLNFFFFFF